MVEVYFHVGAHKTASSLLQNSLQLNKVVLQECGLSYVHKYELNERAFMAYIAEAWDDGPKEFRLNRAVSSRKARKDFAQLVSGLAGPRILMSHENFLGSPELLNSRGRERLYPFAERAMEVLTEVCEAPFHVLLFIRSQPAFLESLYLQRMKSGKVSTFARYLQRIHLDSLSWYRLAKGIEAILGRNRLTIIPYEALWDGPQHYLRLMLQACRTESDQDLAISAEQNPSLSDVAVQIALHAGKLLDLEGRRSLGLFLQRRFGTDKFPRAQLLTPEQRAGILATFANENRLLFETYVDKSLHSPDIRNAYWQEAATAISPTQSADVD